MKLIRSKTYGKTAALLTSLGVSNTDIGDPLSKLFLTTDEHKSNIYNRKLFTDKDGNSTTRLEVSFYNTCLYKK